MIQWLSFLISYSLQDIFGGNLPEPAGKSVKQCGRAYKKFVQDYPDYDINVKLCAFKSVEYQAAQAALNAL